MRLLDSIESKGLAIVGKLAAISQKSRILLETLKSHRSAINNRQNFRDHNNTLSKEDIDSDMQPIVAYVDSYFREECDKWNEVINKTSRIGTMNLLVLTNYEANLPLILQGIQFQNDSLDSIDQFVSEAEVFK
jgi:hypothetical protein